MTSSLHLSFWTKKIIFFGLGLLLLQWSYAQKSEYKFRRFDSFQGLSSDQVNCFLKDKRGFLWIGTLTGLNRFDGQNFKNYRHNASDKESLGDDYIDDLFQDPLGNIWISHQIKYSIYNPSEDRFYQDADAYARSIGLPDANITAILPSYTGKFWVVHAIMGLCSYDAASRQFARVSSAANRDTTRLLPETVAAIAESKNRQLWVVHHSGTIECLDIATNRICYRNHALKKEYNGDRYDYTVYLDKDQDLWVYPFAALGGYLFKTKEKEFVPFNTRSAVYQLKNNIVRGLIQDDDGLIWVATDHGGITLLDKIKGTVKQLDHNPQDKKSISQNSVVSLYKDALGIIWVGTYKKGLNSYHADIFNFQLIQHKPYDIQSLPFNDINDFVEDDLGNLWIGTNGGGLIYYNRQTGAFKQFKHQPSDPASLSGDVIVSLCLDSEKKLWIGTYFGGLNCFDGKRFIRYRHDPANPKSLSTDNVWEIFEDSSKRLWVGTLGGGIFLFDKSTSSFLQFSKNKPDAFRSENIKEINEDIHGNLWVGGDDGVSILNIRTGLFHTYHANDKTRPGLNNNRVTAILRDKKGRMWVGTMKGIHVYLESKAAFKILRKDDGLPEDAIITLVEDNSGNIWATTPAGVLRISLKWLNDENFDFSVRKYDELNGIQGHTFNENAICKLSTGELVFGGASGFNIINPEKTESKSRPSKLILTSLQIMDKEVMPGKQVERHDVLMRTLNEQEQIVLEHQMNFFSISFSELNFFHPEKSRYFYKLSGFSDQWFEADKNSRKVAYTNLDPGKYTFYLKAVNEDGTQLNARPLHITVRPPFWLSGTAYFIYFILIASALLLARWLLLDRERMKFKIEQERIENKRVHELDLLKIKFITNLSHEFKTPLSLILAQTEKLLQATTSENSEGRLQMVHRNAKRLLGFVNQLLDFKKLEIQETTFVPSTGDIVSFVRDLTFSFTELSEGKKVRLEFHSDQKACFIQYDHEKMARVLYNLLSNAFKFTPPNGLVTVSVHRMHDVSGAIEIRVSDTGIGIPQHAQERIFDRFYQHEIPGELVNSGSGIGLSITREFVKLHGGEIKVDSDSGKGAVFTITLPLPNEGPEFSTQGTVSSQSYSKELPSALDTDQQAKASTPGIPAPRLLLVEDNDDFRAYLKDALKSDFDIIEAENGIAALQRASEELPALIVSDVMMPLMNGLDLCRKIKETPTLSHIPVILVTAYSGEDKQLDGLEHGADDFISKPFRLGILQAKIRNLMRLKEQNKLLKGPQHLEIKASEVEITPLDEQLLNKAIGLVEANLANPEYTVEELSSDMAMSRVYLYKKLMAITGKAPLEFIRVVRLRRAAQLLGKSQLTVAEVAYQVGFNNPKLFTRYFKEVYGVLPSAYHKEKPPASGREEL